MHKLNLETCSSLCSVGERPADFDNNEHIVLSFKISYNMEAIEREIRCNKNKYASSSEHIS